LTVSYKGDYRVSITSPAGRTIALFKGKGDSSFALDAKHIGSGLYFAVVHTKNGAFSRRFIVNN
ncbi:MAG: T9SS type A sorting domain-containing protein, partial [Chitinispirillaceae bacterium]|nr:T9SS type A sorting domain-containing protein [Chitinispirillaceae bacterium]